MIDGGICEEEECSFEEYIASILNPWYELAYTVQCYINWQRNWFLAFQVKLLASFYFLLVSFVRMSFRNPIIKILSEICIFFFFRYRKALSWFVAISINSIESRRGNLPENEAIICERVLDIETAAKTRWRKMRLQAEIKKSIRKNWLKKMNVLWLLNLNKWIRKEKSKY